MANWIQKAIKHPGATKRAAARAGESTSEWEQKNKGKGGTAGKRARLGILLSHFRNNK